MCSDAHTLLLLGVGARDHERNVRFLGCVWGAGLWSPKQGGAWAISTLTPAARTWDQESCGIRHSQHSHPPAGIVPCPLERGSTAHGTREGIGLGFAQLSFPKWPRRDFCLLHVVCDTNSTPATALKAGLVKGLRYPSPKIKKIEERKWKNRRKNPQAIPIFDLFPAASMDLIQGSTAPHRAPHSTCIVSCLPWQPAEEGAHSRDLEGALFKGL